MSRLRYSVLQYIFGGYEKIHEIQEKDPEAEYILVTDDPSLKSSTWTVKLIESGLEDRSAIYKSWHVRYHLFDYVNADICISMDASTIIKKSLKPIIDEFENGEYDVAVMPHPCRCTMVKEYAAWTVGRGYSNEQANKCIQFIASLGYDPLCHKGLYQGNFRVSRRCKDNDDYCRITFAFLQMLAGPGEDIERVDQNIASVVMSKWFTKWKVMALSEQAVRSDALTWCYHGSDQPKLDAYAPDGKTWNFEGKYDLSLPDIKWVLGKQQRCFYWKGGKLET